MNRSRPSAPTSASYYLVTALLVLVAAIGSLLIANAVIGAARGGHTLVGARALSVDASVAPDHLKSLPPGIRVRGDAQVTAEVEHPTSAQLLLSAGTWVGPLALLIAALWLLRRLAQSVKAGEPFGPPNVRRLRTLGFLLLLGYPSVQIANWALMLALGNTAPLSDLSTPGLSIQAAPLLAGLGALVLAEVFAHGVRLREDVDATI